MPANHLCTDVQYTVYRMIPYLCMYNRCKHTRFRYAVNVCMCVVCTTVQMSRVTYVICVKSAWNDVVIYFDRRGFDVIDFNHLWNVRMRFISIVRIFYYTIPLHIAYAVPYIVIVVQWLELWRKKFFHGNALKQNQRVQNKCSKLTIQSHIASLHVVAGIAANVPHIHSNWFGVLLYSQLLFLLWAAVGAWL